MRLHRLQVWFAFMMMLPSLGCAQSSLHTASAPQGGKISYGKIDGQANEAGAMGVVLRNLHTQYGVRPQVGRLFQVRNTNSVATFFSLPAGGKNPSAKSGMLIAEKTAPGRVEVGMICDDAQRFAHNMNPMLQTLFEQWHPAAPAGQDTAQRGAVEAMRNFTLPDNSASVQLPASWHVLPGSGGGTILAEGPNKEQVALGFTFYAMDTNNPAAQSAMRFAQGSGRNTVYAKTMYYPYGADLGKTYADMTNMFRRQHGLSPARIEITSERPVPAQGQRCAQLLGRVEVPDDHIGLREMNTVFCSAPPAYGGGYLSGAAHTAVPVALADKERATMGAILASFQPNNAVIQRQANAIAAPTIAAIHEIGKRAAQQARDADEMRISTREHYEKQQDIQDRAAQGYTNTFRENSVVLDKWNNAHGTVDNGMAEALVQSDPNRFEYVDVPNYWKGIDY